VTPAAPERLLVGLDEGVMVPVTGSAVRVHREVLPALAALQEEAARAGFMLEVGSGFRAFERQLGIWNAKARGERPVLDAQERPLQLSTLAPLERVHAILRWSALPGASRHHWGTDLDVFDRAALPPGAAFQMRAEESAPGGPFAPMHAWLDEHLHRFGFFRPYAEERGGVSPERWHLSYAPLSVPLQRAHSSELCERVLRCAEVELGDVVLEHLEQLYRRYVDNVSLPGWA
jgi:LAS superfamily LD-carboxypeptidase LdcB